MCLREHNLLLQRAEIFSEVENLTGNVNIVWKISSILNQKI
jgi:hypothetical protein